MQYERLEALSNGTCIKIDNSLKSNVKSISFELENNKRYEDHISIFNTRELIIEGTAYSDNNRVSIKNPIINDKSVDIIININTFELSDGDKLNGIISIISNLGIININYNYNIIENNKTKIIKKLNTITDYYDYFLEDFNSAYSLFTDKEILKSNFLKNDFVMGLYTGLIKGSSTSIAIIEFFKAFELDIVSLFQTLDDGIAKKYIDDTLDNLDVKQGEVANKLEKILELDKNKEKKLIADDILYESSEVIDAIIDKTLLFAIASMCVRNNFIDEIAFKVYLKVIERGQNISGIFDKFILSIPEDYKKKLPLYVYRYYFEDKSYSFDDKLKLYENIISVFNENDDVYVMYKQEITEYAISRIYQNKITDSLIKIYNNVLSEKIVNENNSNNILYLLRTHRLLIKNREIKKIIIRYNETEKETEYSVINGIAFVPIFFETYIMFFEDAYGNRYYSSDVEIKSLFDKKFLENYIIDKYPPKDIIEMTKVIKLNEVEQLTTDFEVQEILEIEYKMNLNSVIKNNFKSKIIDYYFNKVLNGNSVSTEFINYFKELTFQRLNSIDKKKVLKILLVCQEYQFVYDKILLYGFEYMEDEDIILLFSKNIDLADLNRKNNLMNDILLFMKTRRLDQKCLNFLMNNFDGSIENMIFILDSGASLNLDTSFIAKKLLMICLECGENEYLDHVYNYYDPQIDKDNRMIIAYLNKKATDYMLDDADIDDEYFKKLSNYLILNFDTIEDEPVIFLLAITKYISTFSILSNNDLRRILIKAMEKLLKLELVFSYYKKLNKHMRMPYYIMNKEYIEYHAKQDIVPKAILTISGEDEKKEVELTKMFMNIYVKKITVFKNEIINYEIINSLDHSNGVLSKGTLTYDNNYELEYPVRGKIRSTYDYINDAIVCLDRDNLDGLKKVVIDMASKQEISKILFNI